jgi:hypothetical protein
LALLGDKVFIAGQPESVAVLLDALCSEWKSMSRPQRTEVVRRLVWRATSKPKRERVDLELDELAARSLLEDDESSTIAITRGWTE